MSPTEQLVVLITGLGAGVLTSTVGVASVLSFPVLVAVGLPPLTANATNTVGLTPGALSGSWGYRAELSEHPRVAATVLATCALGAVGGALLLLSLPAGVFEAAAPWLVLVACALVAVQPRIRARIAAGRAPGEQERLHLSLTTGFFATVTGVYGGYFGAGSGVMMLAVLGLGTDIPFRAANALKTLAVLAANLTASVVFLLGAPLEWGAVGLLAVGSVVGGRLGAVIGRVLPVPVLRTSVVLGGSAAAAWLLLG